MPPWTMGTVRGVSWGAMVFVGGEEVAFDAQGPCEFGVEGHCVVGFALPGLGDWYVMLSVTAVRCRKEKRRRRES